MVDGGVNFYDKEKKVDVGWSVTRGEALEKEWKWRLPTNRWQNNLLINAHSCREKLRLQSESKGQIFFPGGQHSSKFMVKKVLLFKVPLHGFYRTCTM